MKDTIKNYLKSIPMRLGVLLVGFVTLTVAVAILAILIPGIVVLIPIISIFAPEDWFDTSKLSSEVDSNLIID